MATYSQLTELQKSTLEYLTNRMRSVARSDTDEETKAKQLYDLRRKVNDVYSAQEEFNACVVLARKFIEKGEELKKEYGLTWTGEL